MSQLYDAVLSPTGIKTTQRAILSQIDRTEPVAVGALAEALVMDAGALAHTLKPLVRDGLIILKTSPEDRRSKRACLTRLGRTKLRETDRRWHRAQRVFEKSLGTEESERLRQAMGYLISSEFQSHFERGFLSAGRLER